MRALRNIAYLVNRRAAGGIGNRAEVLQVRARIAAAQATLAEARHRVRDAYSLYITVVGHKPHKLISGVPRLSYMPRTLGSAIKRARGHSPKILALRHDALAAAAAVGTAQSQMLPKVNFELSGKYANELQGTAPMDFHGKAQVVVRWNLYNGGIDSARIREAKFRASESQALSRVAA